MEPGDIDEHPFLIERRTNGRRLPSSIFLCEQQVPPNRWINCYDRCLRLCRRLWQWLLSHCAPLARLLVACNLLRRPSNDLPVTAESLAQISETRDWATAPIRHIAFHPHCVQMALLTNEDCVLLYHELRATPTSLQHNKQRDVSCAAWRPWTPSQLAVGCAAGVCLWQVKARSDDFEGGQAQLRNMLGSHRLQLLSDRRHNYITSLQWHRDGIVLASAALGTHYIVLWEPDRGLRLRLLPSAGQTSSFRLLSYSPNFQLLFGASSDMGASLWQSKLSCWQQHQFRLKHGIQTAVWTSCDNNDYKSHNHYLLFVLVGDSRLHVAAPFVEASLFLLPEPVWNSEVVADLGSVSCFGHSRECGQPQAIALDPLNVYLAVIFKEQPFVLLCLLALSQGSLPRLLPVNYIESRSDPAGSYPTCMSFGCGVGPGAKSRVLAIGWSSGHVQRHVLSGQNPEDEEQLLKLQWDEMVLAQPQTEAEVTFLYRATKERFEDYSQTTNVGNNTSLKELPENLIVSEDCQSFLELS